MKQTPFTPEQIAQLEQPLDPKRVKHRAGGGGIQLSYLTGHDAIDTANRIFGYGNWGYDLLGVEYNTVSGENGEPVGGYYAARVKLTVAGCIPITEEGVCPAQEGRNPRARIDAHDMARKGAITDALKRALRCYGDQFGNSLYDSDLVDGQPRTAAPNRNAVRSPQTAQPAARPSQNSLERPSGLSGTASQAAATSNGNGYTQPAPATAGLVTAGEAATEQQRQAILKLAGRKDLPAAELDARLRSLYSASLDGLSKADASHFIKLLQDSAA